MMGRILKQPLLQQYHLPRRRAGIFFLFFDSSLAKNQNPEYTVFAVRVAAKTEGGGHDIHY